MSVKVKIGKGALTRDLVWCECGRGLSLHGRWSFCPRCGNPIDQESYQAAIAVAANEFAPHLNPKDESDLLAEVQRLRTEAERDASNETSRLQRATVILAVLALIGASSGDWHVAAGIFVGWYVMMLCRES